MKTNNPILKTDKRSEKILQKRIYENTNMKRHPTSLVIQEIQIKTIRRMIFIHKDSVCDVTGIGDKMS